jgi:transcriptional regulator with XRE-family HTH domain
VQTLREHRRQRGWSQEDLSKAAGVGQDTISTIESGRHEPRPSTLRKLARAFNVEVADLFRPPHLVGRYPELSLAPMYRAQPADRERALRAASAEEVARYVAEIDAAAKSAERTIEEEKDEPLPGAETGETPRVQLIRYALRLGELRREAMIYAPHAGVSEVEDYPALTAAGA